MKTIIYKFLILLLYFIGDFFSKIPFEFAYVIYQKCMYFSVKLDDKIGPFWWWKKP
jgi:hypothetical protein